ncbi:hypothetical protein ABTP16_02480 [Acinetobacter baumannii]
MEASQNNKKMKNEKHPSCTTKAKVVKFDDSQHNMLNSISRTARIEQV